MQIHQPLQRKDGRWDYTSSTGSSGPHAIGYCFNGEKPFYALSWEELSDVVRGLYGDQARWEAEKAKHVERLREYHNTGHTTAEEAVACYRRYEVLEHSHSQDDHQTQKRCEWVGCGVWTTRRVHIGQGFPTEYVLCAPCDTQDRRLALHLKGKRVA